jgi:GTP-binding protein
MGLGLGLEFLRHTERTRMLVHLLDATSDDPMGDYDVINDELRMFKEALFLKPQVAVINKTDVLGTEEVNPHPVTMNPHLVTMNPHVQGGAVL